MRRTRWIIPPTPESPKPVIYHCISRVVNRDFVFGDMEREQQRMNMRMYKNFSGCRVLSYCFMSNHFDVLLEVTPMPEGGLSDAELLERLGAIHSELQVGEVALRARIWAAEADTSLSAFLSRMLTERMENEVGYRRASEDFFSRQPVVLQESPSPYPTRDELHDRSNFHVEESSSARISSMTKPSPACVCSTPFTRISKWSICL